jgi:hypothetical protein
MRHGKKVPGGRGVAVRACVRDVQDADRKLRYKQSIHGRYRDIPTIPSHMGKKRFAGSHKSQSDTFLVKEHVYDATIKNLPRNELATCQSLCPLPGLNWRPLDC